MTTEEIFREMINKTMEGCPYDIEYIDVDYSCETPEFLVGFIKIKGYEEWKLFYYPTENCIYPWSHATIRFDLHDPDVFTKIRATLWAVRSEESTYRRMVERARLLRTLRA